MCTVAWLFTRITILLLSKFSTMKTVCKIWTGNAFFDPVEAGMFWTNVNVNVEDTISWLSPSSHAIELMETYVLNRWKRMFWTDGNVCFESMETYVLNRWKRTFWTDGNSPWKRKRGPSDLLDVWLRTLGQKQPPSLVFLRVGHWKQINKTFEGWSLFSYLLMSDWNKKMHK